MIAAWERWVRFTDRRIDARPLILVRVFVPLCVFGDLLDLVIRGAASAVLVSRPLGGVNDTHSPQLWFDPDTWWVGPFLWLGCMVTMPLISLGIWTRPAIVAGLVFTSQFGHLFQPGDRGIDRLLRTALLILLFSEVTRKRPPARVRAWPVDLIVFLLVLVYLAAGFAKVGGSEGWFYLGLQPELYRILADPLAGRLDADFWVAWPLPFRVGSWATMVLEMTPFLLLSRFRPYWALFGAFMHLGIAAWMHLGMFSYGMLAFYPLLFSPWTEAVLDRWGLRLGVHDDEEPSGAAAGAADR